MKFVASADWQLGKQAHFLPEEARARYAQARLDVVRRIGAIATEEGADFVVVGGDVFESNQLDRRILRRTFEVLRDYSVPVYLLPGNHDPLDASSIYTSREWERDCPPGVHVLGTSGVAEKLTPSEGPHVQLIAAPWFSKRPGCDLVRAAVSSALRESATSPDHPTGARPFRIVVGHGAVSSLSPDADLAEVIDQRFLIDRIAEGELDFVTLGDRHSTTEVAPAIWYPGTPEVTAERETDPGNVLVIDISHPGDLPRVEVRKVGRWSLQVIPFDLSDEDDLRRLETRLGSVGNKEITSVKLALTGTLSVRRKVALDDLLAHFRDLFARLDIWESHSDLVVIPEGEDFVGTNLAGFALDAARELQERADADGDDALAAADALGLLLRLSGECA